MAFLGGEVAGSGLGLGSPARVEARSVRGPARSGAALKSLTAIRAVYVLQSARIWRTCSCPAGVIHNP